MASYKLAAGMSSGTSVMRSSAGAKSRTMLFKLNSQQLAALPADRCSIKASRGRRSCMEVQCVASPEAPAKSGNVLPWQAAMSEIKKRRDIKKIMIIGAGPIVIGQV